MKVLNGLYEIIPTFFKAIENIDNFSDALTQLYDELDHFDNLHPDR